MKRHGGRMLDISHNHSGFTLLYVSLFFTTKVRPRFAHLRFARAEQVHDTCV
uniref:Uncharacterized protein n=1 Tax=Anguilla anguilla TaxID=7936 RepID=A0A0E9VFA6_ANGAN